MSKWNTVQSKFQPKAAPEVVETDTKLGVISKDLLNKDLNKFKPPKTPNIFKKIPPKEKRPPREPTPPPREPTPPPREPTPPPREPTPPPPREPTPTPPREPTPPPREPTPPPREPTPPPREPTPPPPREPTPTPPREPTPTPPREPTPTPPREPTPPPPREPTPPPPSLPKETESKPYVESWQAQTEKRLNNEKVQNTIRALVAAQRFKKLLNTRRPPGPEPELPLRWQSYRSTIQKNMLNKYDIDRWNLEVADRFLTRAWGDPYFASEVLVENQRVLDDLTRRKEAYRDEIRYLKENNTGLSNYAKHLESTNELMRLNYLYGTNLPSSQSPQVYSQNQYETQFKNRAKLIEDFVLLRKKQQYDQTVLENYSSKLGGHLNRRDINSTVRVLNYTTDQYAALKNQYFKQKNLVDEQEKVIHYMENLLKSRTNTSRHELDSISNEYAKHSARVNKYLTNPFTGNLTELNDNIPNIYGLGHGSNYERTKLLDRIDRMHAAISDLKHERKQMEMQLSERKLRQSYFY